MVKYFMRILEQFLGHLSSLVIFCSLFQKIGIPFVISPLSLSPFGTHIELHFVVLR